jgi:hypothetical protein
LSLKRFVIPTPDRSVAGEPALSEVEGNLLLPDPDARPEEKPTRIENAAFLEVSPVRPFV